LNAVEVIKTKRDGGMLSDEQIRWFIEAYTAGEIADEQASALLMAIVWRGLSAPELTTWTASMIDSGERLDLSSIDAPTVDKHSTGGVGDKVSLVLAPLIAACGAVDPMLSGRGLGHTGGTLDKLEAVPGFRVDLSFEEIIATLRRAGCVICAAGPRLAPADKRLYALRDVTGTVESIPLIASSIMSKKIAEGTDALVLDVKVGSGAFMPDISSARELAETMVGLGRDHGLRTTALLTAMDAPLGRTAGNALEVVESIETLRGRGPSDLRTITLELAREMLDLVGLDARPEEELEAGRAYDRFTEMVDEQGGDLAKGFPEAQERRVIRANTSGYIARMDARAIGVAAWRLGAGRARKEDNVSATAGVVCLKKPGDTVEEGEPLVELHSDAPDRFQAAIQALEGGMLIAAHAPEPAPLVLDRVRP
jgi:thymidine phosphorylase